MYENKNEFFKVTNHMIQITSSHASPCREGKEFLQSKIKQSNNGLKKNRFANRTWTKQSSTY